MKAVFCRIVRCVGCRSCELACAVEHSKSKDLVRAVNESPVPLNRIRVLATGEPGRLVSLKAIALQCRQCSEPACVEACICGGIVKDAESGRVSFNSDLCVGCWSCTMVCPYGAIVRVKSDCHTIKCDLCPDRDIPACVTACPTRALVFCEPEEFEVLVRLPDMEKEAG